MSNPTSTSKLKVLIVEDEPLYRDLLTIALGNDAQIEVVAALADGESALAAARELQPQVATLDIEISGPVNGVQLGIQLRDILPELGIVLLSNHQDPAFLSPMQRQSFTGWSYLLKTSACDLGTLQRAIKGAANGYVVLDPKIVEDLRPNTESPLQRLTPRQTEILELIAQGFTNAAIARTLHLSPKSVENQINVIYQQLEIDRGNRSIQPRVTAVLTYLEASGAV